MDQSHQMNMDYRYHPSSTRQEHAQQLGGRPIGDPTRQFGTRAASRQPQQPPPIQGMPLHPNQQAYMPSMMSDITSTAGYTLSGGGNDRQQQPAVASHLQLTEEHVTILLEQGFSRGLAKALAENAQSFEHRIWVVDNSGSMQIQDGHRVNKSGGKITMVPVSRWEEIQDTVIYHSQMAALLNSRTHFRLLNDPGPSVGAQEFSVAETSGDVESDILRARTIMTKTKPDGVTPLTEHILAMQKEIRQMLPQLRRSGRRVAVILATDGLPTDDEGYGGDEITNEFIRALRALEGLPIWLVIRLCTDEDKVTEFYNQLDGMLELSLEVLDDFMGECAEVRIHNPWLNYALPMHRCRELGYHDRLFDLIDERALTKGELRNFCVLLFGTEFEAIPDPVADWNAFVRYIREQLSHEKPQWNPLQQKMKPWISLRKLNRRYNGPCTIM